jgi:hypothetical protein
MKKILKKISFFGLLLGCKAFANLHPLHQQVVNNAIELLFAAEHSEGKPLSTRHIAMLSVTNQLISSDPSMGRLYDNFLEDFFVSSSSRGCSITVRNLICLLRTYDGSDEKREEILKKVSEADPNLLKDAEFVNMFEQHYKGPCEETLKNIQEEINDALDKDAKRQEKGPVLDSVQGDLKSFEFKKSNHYTIKIMNFLNNYRNNLHIHFLKLSSPHMLRLFQKCLEPHKAPVAEKTKISLAEIEKIREKLEEYKSYCVQNNLVPNIKNLQLDLERNSGFFSGQSKDAASWKEMLEKINLYTVETDPGHDGIYTLDNAFDVLERLKKDAELDQMVGHIIGALSYSTKGYEDGHLGQEGFKNLTITDLKAYLNGHARKEVADIWKGNGTDEEKKQRFQQAKKALDYFLDNQNQSELHDYLKEVKEDPMFRVCVACVMQDKELPEEKLSEDKIKFTCDKILEILNDRKEEFNNVNSQQFCNGEPGASKNKIEQSVEFFFQWSLDIEKAREINNKLVEKNIPGNYRTLMEMALRYPPFDNKRQVIVKTFFDSWPEQAQHVKSPEFAQHMQKKFDEITCYKKYYGDKKQ